MSERLPLVERAFQLAESGELSKITDIRRSLRNEGYTYAEISAVLEGLQIQSKLRALITAAREGRDDNGIS